MSRIYQHIQRPRQDFYSRIREVSVHHLIPLSLQSLCLLRVINDLDCYPLKLLALLPLWLRGKLLRNLPDVDLCCLEYTPVASGVDTDQIWESKSRNYSKHFSEKPSLTEFYYNTNTRKRFGEYSDTSLDDKVKLTLNETQETTSVLSPKEKYLSKIIASYLFRRGSLPRVPNFDLISVNGTDLLKDLSQYPDTSPEESHVTWKNQGTALYRSVSSEDLVTVLIPHRLWPKKHIEAFNEQLSFYRVFSLLANYCCVQLPSVRIHMNELNEHILSSLYNGNYALNRGLQLSALDKISTSLIDSLLRNVSLLQLRCNKYVNIGIMKRMIEAATVNKEENGGCQLKYFYCLLPDMFFEMVKPLSRLFSLKNFTELRLELVEEAYLLHLTELVHCFLSVPCSHSQFLHIQINIFTKFPRTNKLEILDNDSNTPECALEHKHFSYTERANVGDMVLYILLQLPRIRLNEITVRNSFLHLSAIHPDLLVKRLNLRLYAFNKDQGLFITTIQSDIISLLSMPTLEEVSITGGWSSVKEMKLGLKNGLVNRRQLAPLNKISLHTDSLRFKDKEVGYSEEEYRELWDAIFSLPNVERLDITLGEQFTKLTTEQKYSVEILESWVNFRAHIKLKSITFTLTESEETTPEMHERVAMPFKKLAQTVTFITKENTKPKKAVQR